MLTAMRLLLLALTLALGSCVDKRQVQYLVMPTPPAQAVTPVPTGVQCWQEGRCRWEL